jgi:hypothetical protein|tara:strand:- start:25 stop:216 length:192 start_codon:yes stop_codon:yes gene_type:complete
MQAVAVVELIVQILVVMLALEEAELVELVLELQQVQLTLEEVVELVVMPHLALTLLDKQVVQE